MSAEQNQPPQKVTGKQIREATKVQERTLHRWVGLGYLPPAELGPGPDGKGRTSWWSLEAFETCKRIVAFTKDGHNLATAATLAGCQETMTTARSANENTERQRNIDIIALSWQNIIRALGYATDDPHLRESPQRVARFFSTWHTKANREATPKITTFKNEGHYDEIVLTKGIKFFSLCAHHGLPFFGEAAIGYIPNDKILGLSKFARVIDFYAHRFQVQEQLTKEVAEYLQKILAPKALGVVMEATHLCMAMRGVERPGHCTKTSAMLGLFREVGARQEFFSLLQEK